MCLHATYAEAICLALWFANVACAAQVSYPCTDASVYIDFFCTGLLSVYILDFVQHATVQVAIQYDALWSDADDHMSPYARSSYAVPMSFAAACRYNMQLSPKEQRT